MKITHRNRSVPRSPLLKEVGNTGNALPVFPGNVPGTRGTPRNTHDDEIDRYPGNLPTLLRAQERAHHHAQKTPHKDTPSVGTAGAVAVVVRKLGTPRTRERLLVMAYLVLSLFTCLDLAAPDSRSSGAPITAGQGAAVTRVSPTAASR